MRYPFPEPSINYNTSRGFEHKGTTAGLFRVPCTQIGKKLQRREYTFSMDPQQGCGSMENVPSLSLCAFAVRQQTFGSIACSRRSVFRINGRYSISRTAGTLVVVHPDGYVSIVALLDKLTALDAYFAGFMLQRCSSLCTPLMYFEPRMGGNCNRDDLCANVSQSNMYHTINE